MNKVTLEKDKKCEICGETIHTGEEAFVHLDYDWDNPDEDLQGSFAIYFYRHADKDKCEKGIELRRIEAKIAAVHEEDVFRKAIY